MEKDNFEMKLKEMTKPEMPHLKHEEMLSECNSECETINLS